MAGKEEPKPAADGAKTEGAAVAAPGGGGLKAMVPLIAMIVLMPALSIVTTKYLIIPKVMHAREGGSEESDGGKESKEGKESAKSEHGGKESAKPEHGAAETGKSEHGGKEGKPGKKRSTFALTKLIVNVSGSLGTRYLLASATLAGSNPDFKSIIEENKEQLLDLAIGALSTKTISDLEKPGARNQLRAELISIFNNALGSGVVQEIFFTEFAIQ